MFVIILIAIAAQTVQLRSQTPGAPVQNLHFTQTPGGQLQVRGLLPGNVQLQYVYYLCVTICVLFMCVSGRLRHVCLLAKPGAASTSPYFFFYSYQKDKGTWKELGYVITGCKEQAEHAS